VETVVVASVVVPLVIVVVATILVKRMARRALQSSFGGATGNPFAGMGGSAGNPFGGTPGPTVGGVSSTVRGGSADAAAQLQATGAKARAQVLQVRSTGLVVNQVNVRCEVTFGIQPLDGSPSFQGVKSMLLNQTQMPRLGDLLPCWYDRADPTVFAVAMLTQATPETITMYREFGIRHPLDGTAAAPPPPPARSAGPDTVEELERLAAMHRAGSLTDDEFDAAKRRILGT